MAKCSKFYSKCYLHFKVQVINIQHAVFSFVSGKHERQPERKSESFFIIWTVPVHFEDDSKSLWTSISSEHLAKISQSFLGIATLMKMSNILHIDCCSAIFEQVKISQAAEGALGQSMKNSFPVVLGCVPTRSPWRHQTLKSKHGGVLNFYLRQVEGERAPWRLSLSKYSFLRFPILSVHRDNTQQHGVCLIGIDIRLTKSSLLTIFSCLNISGGTKCVYGHLSLLTNKKTEEKAFLSQEWNPMSLLISGPNIGVSIQSSIKLRETFWKITKRRCTAQTWDLDML